MASNENAEPWVVNCGYVPTAPSGPIPSEINTTHMFYVDGDARHALTYAREDFQKQVVEELAKTGLNPETTFATANFDWLPKLPNLSDDAEKQAHLNNFKSQCVDGLLSLYKNLQVMAVALDAVISDYNKSEVESSLKTGAGQLYGLIKNVLCDLQDVLIQNNIPITETVDRDIVPSEYRDIANNKTRRAERDWIVLREFIKLMEYTIQVSEHLTKSDASPSS